MNLQICFMNETASDNESQASECDRNINSNAKSMSRTSLFSKNSYNHNHPYQTRPLSVNITKHDKISTVQSGEYFQGIVINYYALCVNQFARLTMALPTLHWLC